MIELIKIIISDLFLFGILVVVPLQIICMNKEASRMSFIHNFYWDLSTKIKLNADPYPSNYLYDLVDEFTEKIYRPMERDLRPKNTKFNLIKKIKNCLTTDKDIQYYRNLFDEELLKLREERTRYVQYSSGVYLDEELLTLLKKNSKIYQITSRELILFIILSFKINNNYKDFKPSPFLNKNSKIFYKNYKKEDFQFLFSNLKPFIKDEAYEDLTRLFSNFYIEFARIENTFKYFKLIYGISRNKSVVDILQKLDELEIDDILLELDHFIKMEIVYIKCRNLNGKDCRKIIK